MEVAFCTSASLALVSSTLALSAARSFLVGPVVTFHKMTPARAITTKNAALSQKVFCPSDIAGAPPCFAFIYEEYTALHPDAKSFPGRR